jgi:O-antigen/teichoic acid export membrane protein
MTIGSTLKREARVAFSKKAQPVWFRVTKWAVIVAFALVFWRNRYFWWTLLGLFVVGLILHLIWRWKTKGWTQPWGGWNDLEAGRKD